jgi:large subunit ribosomal protein L30
MKLKITQVKSTIDRPARQKNTLKALGIRKMHQTVVHHASPQIVGMLEQVAHLLKIEEVSE